MRIGIVCYPTFGGSGALATELAMALARRGQAVHLISYAPPFRLRSPPPGLKFHQVQVSTYPLFLYPPYDLALASTILEVAETEGLDLVHAHYAIPHAMAAHQARQMLGRDGLKLVTTLHGTDTVLVGAEKAYRRVTRFALEQSDGVTAVSEWLARESARVFETTIDIRVIANFVDVQRFAPRADPGLRRRYARPEEKLLVHASNFRPVKRVSDVVRVFAAIRRRLPCRLVLAGDGPERAAACELARELGVAGEVACLGRQEDVEGLLQLADLFLLPSEFESFGLAALEAMACGVPVVASRAGGLPEVIEDGASGFLCPVGDVSRMVDCACQLLEDPDRHAAFAAAARRTAVERYPEERVVPAYESYYRAILAGRAR